MNAQELRNLQEAYLEVVENQQLNEAEGSYGQTPTARKAYGDLANKRRATPASGFSQRGEKTQKVKSAQKHFDRTGNPDAGNRGKKSSRPYYPGGRKGMTQKDRDWSRGADEYGHSGYDGEGGGGSLPKGKKLERQRKTGVSAESYDIYDIILSHLLDEGYAETPEAAEVIMVNMSEDWREDIVEAAAEMTPQKRDFMQRQKAKLIDSGKIEQAKKVNAATYYTDVDASRKKETNNRRRGGNKPNPATPDTGKRKYRSGGFSKKPEETERDYLDRRWDVAQYLRSKE